MKLRVKTAVFAVAVVILSITALYVSSQYVLIESFADLERQMVDRSIRRISCVLSEQLYALSIIVRDWAMWDDTYRFITDRNDTYIKSNLATQTFENLKINMMLYFDLSGKLVFGKLVDLDSGKELNLPEWLCDDLRSQKDVLCRQEGDRGAEGIITLGGKPVFLVSRPILPTEEDGTVRGTLVMGRYLNPADVERLFRTILFSVSLHLLDDPNMPPDFKVARASLNGKGSSLIRVLSKDTVAGYVLLDDIHGEPAVIFKVTVPRDIYKEGKLSVSYFMIYLLMGGGLTTLIALFLLEKHVLRRLLRLGREIGAIGASGDFSGRVFVEGSDELSSLAGLVNSMLASLQQSREKLEESEERYRLSADYIPIHLAATDKTGKFILWNKHSEKMLGYGRDEMIGKMTPYDIVVSKESAENVIRTAVQKGICESEITYRHKNGNSILAHLVVVSHKDARGEVVALYGFAEDITERKEMEVKLRERLGELERFQKVTLGREKRIIELKEEVERLKKIVGGQTK